MNAGDKRSSMRKLKIPRDLYEEIGSQEKITHLIKVGILSLKTTSLEREIADLTKRTADLKRKIAEFPPEIERFQKLSEEALKDQKTLETLLAKKR